MATKDSPSSVSPPRDPRQVESWVSPADAKPSAVDRIQVAAEMLDDAAELLTHAHATTTDGRLLNDLDFVRKAARLLADHVQLLADRAKREGGGA